MSISARKEASIRRFDGLTPNQQSAASQAYHLLLSLCARPWTGTAPNPGRPSFLPRLDAERLNHTILIDGARGSGKTTVLLTLLEAFSKLWDGFGSPIDGAPKGPFPPIVRNGEEGNGGALKEPASPLDETRPKALQTSLIVPLDIVELHPLPTATSLFLHIASRFQVVLQSIEQGPGAPPWHPKPTSQKPSARVLWQRFVQAVAAGWDSNVLERRAQLDPEEYALELEESATKGITVHQAFHRFLDALTIEFQGSLGRAVTGTLATPMFVVPIDDADMNPHRATELIDLLRSIWHPRVVFLLTGNTEMFLTALRAQYLAMLRRPLARLRASDEELHHLGDRSGPTRLAEEVYARVVPRSHRCQLPPLALAERIHAGGPEREVPKRLRDVLAKVPVGNDGGEPVALDTYFSANEQLLEALPDRLRGLLDIANAIELEVENPVKDGIERPIIPRVVNVLWSDTLSRSSLSPEQDGAVRQLLDIDEGTQHLAVAAWSLRWSAVSHELRFIPQEQRLLRLSRVTRLNAVNRRTNAVPLPDLVVSAMMLAVDLAADDPCVFLVGASPAAPAFRDAFVDAQFRSSRLGTTVSFSWPLPSWQSFRDHLLFSRGWYSYHKAHPDDPIENIAKAFLELVLQLQEHPFEVPTLPPENVRSWPEIAAAIAHLTDCETTKKADRSQRFVAWAIEKVLLMAAPECGLPTAIANDLFKNLTETFTEENWVTRWESSENSRKTRRAVRLRRAAVGDPVEGGDPRRPDRRNIEEHAEALRRELHATEYDFCLRYGKDLLSIESAHPRGAITPADELSGEALYRTFQSLATKVETKKGTFLEGRWVALGDYLFGGREDVLESSELFRTGGPVHTLLAKRRAVEHAPARVILPSIWDAMAPFDKRTVIRNRTNHLVVADLIKSRRRDAPSQDNPGLGLTFDLGAITTEFDLPSMPRELSIVYRVAWDIAADEEDLSAEGCHSAAFSPYWDGIGIHVSGCDFDHEVPWLVPNFDAILDWEVLDESWSAMAIRAASSLSEDAKMNTAVLDGVAIWLIEAVLSIARDRTPHPLGEDFQFANAESASSQQAAGYLQTLISDHVLRARSREQDGKLDGRRWAAFKEWREAIPLLAAPESGLSRGAAAAILSGAGFTARVSGEKKALLRARRLERAMRAVGSSGPEAAKKLLEAADKLHDDHPWLKRIGRSEP